MFHVFLSISTKSTDAPQLIAQFAEATKVLGTVHTLSPFFIPKAIHAKCRALEALLTATPYFALEI